MALGRLTLAMESRIRAKDRLFKKSRTLPILRLKNFEKKDFVNNKKKSTVVKNNSDCNSERVKKL